ncbi:cytochrome d ubiquinol oxidase subunit II [Streptosporangiaceae bacterium NEAU-GS5]|nr:cytochrome d ubiquinol oxidase subunit II [Streptosporangiaceae bacterium NEAU-GS5]
MDTLWYVIFALLFAGYFALEGFTIGVGILLRLRPHAARDLQVAAIAPFVLAGEVWLVALAGLLFGVFPLLEGDLLSGMYPLVVALLLAWILRDAALWFRRRGDGPRWRPAWDVVLSAASLALAIVWGMVLVAIMRGFPGGFDPLGVAAGVGVALAYAFHGWTFATWRLAGHPAVDGASRRGRAVWLSALVAAAPALLTLAVVTPSLLDHMAPSATLNVIGFMVLPLTPVMIGAQVWVWRTFSRGPLPSFF